MISENSKILLSRVQVHSGNKLKYLTELEYIIDLSGYSTDSAILDKIMFTGKYLTGLKTIFSKEIIEEKSKQNILSEFVTNIELLIFNLSELLKSGEDEIVMSFRKKFLDNTSDALKNLNGFIEDLAIVKNYFNDLR
ncbi:MAG TPA: hypothetical protein VIL99_15455 [Ignavibacteria bacterium]